MALPSLQQMLARLVALPSVSCSHPEQDQSNLAVVEQLASWFSQLGFQCQIQPLEQPGKANLIACLGQGTGGLILAGHTDTVPYDAALWQQDPFTLVERDQRLYGLGTADMKGFFPIILDTLSQIDLATLQAPLIVIATADEETSMAGAKALQQSHVQQASAAIIGEPTSLKPIRAHKGIMTAAVRIKGQSGHSSDPRLGHNAIEGMQQVLSALLTWRRQLQQRYQLDDFAVPYPTLNLGSIHGGDNPNRICGHCELHIDLRPLPGMGLTELSEQLRHQVVPDLSAQGLTVSVTPLMEPVPAFNQAAESELVQLCEGLTQAQSETVAFCTEAPFLQQLGVNTLVMGPGHIAQAHRPNEYLELASIYPMQQHLQALIKHYCLAA